MDGGFLVLALARIDDQAPAELDGSVVACTTVSPVLAWTPARLVIEDPLMFVFLSWSMPYSGQCQNSASRVMIGMGIPSSQSRMPRPTAHSPC